MSRRPFLLGASLALLAVGLPACGATRSVTAAPRCRVDGSPSLVAKAGGEEAVCTEVMRVLGQDLPAGTAVRVTIASPSHVIGQTTLNDGRTLPEVETSVSDAELRLGSFTMLANGLKQQLKSFTS